MVAAAKVATVCGHHSRRRRALGELAEHETTPSISQLAGPPLRISFPIHLKLQGARFGRFPTFFTDLRNGGGSGGGGGGEDTDLLIKLPPECCEIGCRMPPTGGTTLVEVAPTGGTTFRMLAFYVGDLRHTWEEWEPPPQTWYPRWEPRPRTWYPRWELRNGAKWLRNGCEMAAK